MLYKIFFVSFVSMPLLLLILIASLEVSATTSDKVNQWFDNQNYINTTRPGVYEGQTARYATFGGISTRAAITQPFQLIDLQTPKFSAGCGGIDFYTGGFSAINADQFIQGLRAIGQNAQSLAFMLAIQVVSPQLAGVMQKIQEWANEFKKLSKDSCAIATQMVGGTMDFFGAREGNCTVKRMQDYGEDWEHANYACTNGGQLKTTEASGEGANKVAFVKGNLAWYVLMQDPYFKNDLEFAEIIMNLTGTLLISDADSGSDAKSSIIPVEPALNDNIKNERFENIKKALLMGKGSNHTLMLYRCETRNNNPDGCTKLTDMREISPDWEGLFVKVNNIVRSIINKIYSDENLSLEEKGLINATSIPLHRFLTVLSAYYPRGNDLSSIYHDYTALIAIDILLKSLNTTIARVEQQASMLKNGMSNSVQVKEYRAKIQHVLKGIAELSKENRVNAEKSLEMLQRIQMYEKTLMSRVGSGFISSALWGSR
ncbi:MAG: conjugal transfer protein TraH [Oligoflexia bacterium]|nr:conjugal transfer protein TraH [Oligoflexia bacterium]